MEIMITHDPATVAIDDPSRVGEARRVAVSMAEAIGFNETIVGQVAIVVTEVATNILRHAKAGEIVLRSLPGVDCCGLEVLGLDRGPGLANVAEAMRDGFSTAATAGTGMGAIGRLSRTLDIFSAPGQGTAVLAHFRVNPPDPDATHESRVGWVCLPKAGETACGDACDVVDLGEGRTMIVVADGLGHGLRAAEASRLALRVFRENVILDGPEVVQRIHAALRGTRGAAVTVVDLRRRAGELRLTGVGNVAGRIARAGAMRGLIGQNGTAGVELRRVQEHVYPWSPGSLLLLHSDGLSSQWQLAAYRGLSVRHPALIAGVLYRDFRRERDDVTVLALSEPEAA